jgi:ABC-type nitrate/sulfonate/bicarbonate transport system substrate-binding protein
VLARFMRAIGQSMRWLNDPANEREAVRVMMERLKIDETVAARTFKFMIPENRAYRGEGLVDPVGLNEMIRLLALDNLIPERKPWETFIDSGFLPATSR